MNKVVSIGAGVIGVAIALTLQREGCNVLLIDLGLSFGDCLVFHKNIVNAIIEF